MLEHVFIKDILFLDIETVPTHPDLSKIDPKMQQLWAARSQFYAAEHKQEDPNAYYFENAGLVAEFGKVICITLGFLAPQKTETGTSYQLRLRTWSGHDEKNDVLKPFFELLKTISERYYLCGHNIREFDIPFLCRRAVINQLTIPQLLDISNQKPWEIKHLDTIQIWRFGEPRHLVSLHLICASLGINSPKSDLAGGKIAQVYWQENDLERIAVHHYLDIIAIVQLILRFKQLPPLDEQTQQLHI